MTSGWDVQLHGEKRISNSGLEGVQRRPQDPRRKKRETWQDVISQSFEIMNWRCGRSAGEVLYEHCRSAGLQWEPYKGETFRRNSKVQSFSGMNDTELSCFNCWLWYEEIRPWWPPLWCYHSSKTVDMALAQQSFTCEHVLAQGF